MKRKVIKQGNNTLTITLPRSWTTKYNVKAGDEIELTEKGKSLVIGEHEGTSERHITVDISNLDRTTILILIQGIYRFGYDTIEITTKNSLIPHHRLQKDVSVSELIYAITNRLVGAEVISATPNRYLIKRIAGESVEEFPIVLRRIFLLLNEMIESFIQGTQKNDIEIIKSLEFQHSNIKKFINLCLRLLNKYGYEDPRKTCFYFNIISLLSKAEDIIKNNGRYMLKYKIRLKNGYCFELLEDVKSHIRMFYELFYSYNINKIAELDKHRDIFRDKLFKFKNELSKEESLIIGGLSQIVELILDMSETRMALED